MPKRKMTIRRARRFAYRAGDGERFVATVSSSRCADFLAMLASAGGDLLHATAIHEATHPPRLTAIEREILIEKATDPRRTEYDPEFHAWAVANGLEGARNVALV